MEDSYIPVIRQVLPTIDDKTVTADTTISAVFSIPLAPSQFADDASLAERVVLLDLSTDTAVPVTLLSYDEITKTLSFKPAQNLTPQKTYQITFLQLISSLAGRKMASSRSFEFTVAGTSIVSPVLISPGDKTAFSTNPTLIFTSAEYTSGIALNEVQLATASDFATVVWSTTDTASAVTPAVSLSPNTTYWWRARGVCGELVSSWSDARNFFFAANVKESPSPSYVIPESPEFYVSRLIPKVGATNLSEWPAIEIVMNTTIAASSVTSGSVYLEAVQIDNASAYSSGVAAVVTVTGSKITVVPTEDISTNTRYTVTIEDSVTSEDGVELPEKVETYFTGAYSPLYASALDIRGRIGGLIADVSDDLINYHLWKASKLADAKTDLLR